MYLRYLWFLFAAIEPATPAATIARTVMTASAMLSIKVVGRRPQHRLLCARCGSEALVIGNGLRGS